MSHDIIMYIATCQKCWLRFNNYTIASDHTNVASNRRIRCYKINSTSVEVIRVGSRPTIRWSREGRCIASESHHVSNFSLLWHWISCNQWINYYMKISITEVIVKVLIIKIATTLPNINTPNKVPTYKVVSYHQEYIILECTLAIMNSFIHSYI